MRLNDPDQYTDVYFLRGRRCLEADGINPWTRARLFTKKGPGQVHGLTEAIEILDHFGKIEQSGGAVYALDEGAYYDANETLMVIEAPLLNFMHLETVMIGVISAETTKANDETEPDPNQVYEAARRLKGLIGNRTLIYMGSRHWRWDKDAEISAAVKMGGADLVTTPAGAITSDRLAGTIPHSMQCAYAFQYGRENAVAESLKAFDRVMEPDIKRISLVDFNNREENDIRASVTACDNLYGVRLDTCGENVAQWAVPGIQKQGDKVRNMTGMSVKNPEYWVGPGVTVTAAMMANNVLDDEQSDANVILSSGFAKPEKVEAFVDAEERVLEQRLFSAIGAGALFNARVVTMDVTDMASEPTEDMVHCAKAGREYIHNPRLKRIL